MPINEHKIHKIYKVPLSKYFKIIHNNNYYDLSLNDILKGQIANSRQKRS